MAALACDWLRHFRLLLWNRWTEFNETWQEARSQRPLPRLCFSGRSEKQDGRTGLWLAETFSTSLLKPLIGIQRNLTGSKISKPSTKFVFFWPIGKTRWPPWPLIGRDIFDFSSETTEPNSTKFDRKQDLKALYQVCVFRPIGKTIWPPRPLIGWDIFDFFSETAEQNSTNLDRKQDLNALYQGCVFRADRKNKMAAWPLIGWDIFRLLLWNRWMEFNETWQESRSKRPLPSLCFLGWSEKQDGRPGLWLAETFSTSPMKPLNRIQWNLIGSKISTPSTKFVFFGPIGKTKWPPWPLIGWDIFDFSSETVKGIWRNLIGRSQCPLPSLCFSGGLEKQNGRPGLWFAETFSTFPLKPLNRIQENLTRSKISTSSTRHAFFGLIRKTRLPPCPLIGWDIFDFSYETTERNSTKLDRKQVLNVLYQVCVFRADPKNNMAALASDWLGHILTFPLKPLNGIQRNLTGSKILTSSTKFVFFGPKSE